MLFIVAKQVESLPQKSICRGELVRELRLRAPESALESSDLGAVITIIAQGSINGRTARWLVVCGLAVTLQITAACSLINPHVTWEKPSYETQPSLQDGIDYANRANEEYIEAVGNQALLNNGLALGLIPLSAAAIGLGIYEASGQAVAILGLTGATAYASATWLSSTPRQRIYIAGTKAMSCAVGAMLPFDLANSSLSTDLDALNSAIGSARVARARLQGLIEPLSESSSTLVVRSRQSVDTATTLIDSSSQTYSTGVSLELEVSRAGRTLINAVDNISADVNRAILETQPDLTALPDVISSLAQLSSQFTAVPEVPSAPPSEPEVPEEAEEPADSALGRLLVKSTPAIETALEVLENAMAALSNSHRRVAAIVNSVDAAKQIETLESCGVDTSQLATDITVDPPGPIELTKGETKGLLIRGGKAPFLAHLQDDAVAGLTIRQIDTFGPAFTVSTTDQTPAGKYVIYLADSANHRRFVELKVNGDEPPPDDTSTGNVSDDDSGVSERGSSGTDTGAELPEVLSLPVGALTEGEFNTILSTWGIALPAERWSTRDPQVMGAIKEIQFALGMSGNQIDGIMGPRTRGRIQEFRNERGLGPGVHIDEELLRNFRN